MNRVTRVLGPAILAWLTVVNVPPLFGFPGGQNSNHQGKPELKEFPLWKFDEFGCRAKGRFQDKDYCESTVMDQILAQGKDAIPILISQISDTRPTKEPIIDFWGPMTVGDVAYLVLDDLFLDSDWKTQTMPGLKQIGLDCGASAQQCYQRLLKKHGRNFIQNQWLATWNANKDRVYWDSTARCFKLRRVRLNSSSSQ
jgi:hypothetical protein